LANALRTLDELGHPTLHQHTASDGYVWHYRRYSTSEPKGRLIFLHGIQSHGGWYPKSCSQLAQQGYEVYFLERRGCGLNTENRGDIPSFRRCLDDVAEFLKTLPDDLAKTLGAISWGGKLGVALQHRHPGLVQRVALLCPGLFPKIQPPFLQRMKIGRCALTSPRRLFPIPLNDPKLFTTSPEAREFLAKDPLSLHEATARMLFQSNALDIYLRRTRRSMTMPTLLMLAERDLIIDNAHTRRWVESFPGQTTIIEYPGSHHTLEFEPDGHPFVNDLVKWIEG
jgi:alpha-beta hydrolase superfamily lysophospholipase